MMVSSSNYDLILLHFILYTCVIGQLRKKCQATDRLQSILQQLHTIIKLNLSSTFCTLEAFLTLVQTDWISNNFFISRGEFSSLAFSYKYLFYLPYTFLFLLYLPCLFHFLYCTFFIFVVLSLFLLTSLFLYLLYFCIFSIFIPSSFLFFLLYLFSTFLILIDFFVCILYHLYFLCTFFIFIEPSLFVCIPSLFLCTFFICIVTTFKRKIATKSLRKARIQIQNALKRKMLFSYFFL